MSWEQRLSLLGLAGVTAVFWGLLLAPPQWFPVIENPTVRYTLQGGFHLLLHAFLTWLARLTFRRFAWGRANRWSWVGFGLLSAGLSEAAQHWIPGRVADGWDLLCNLVGVGIVGVTGHPGKR